MAASEFYVGTFSKSTNISVPVDQVITDPGFTVKALIMWCSNLTIASEIQPHIVLSFGFSDGTTDKCVTFNDEDAQGTSDADRYQSSDRIVRITGLTGASVADAVVKSFDATGFTLTWTTANDANAVQINYIAIGGSNVTNAEVGSFTGIGSTGVQNVSALADANFIICAGANHGTEDASQAHFIATIGAATSATARWGMGFTSANNKTVTQTARYRRNDSFLVNATVAATPTGVNKADFNGFTVSGFDIDWVTANTNDYYYLLIKGGNFEVGEDATKTTTGTQAYTTTNKPTGVALFSISGTTSGTAGNQNRFCIGAASDSTEEASVSGASKDNVTSSIVDQSQSTTDCFHTHNETSTLDKARLASFNSADFTLDFQAGTDANARDFFWFTMDEDLGAAGTILPQMMQHHG